VLDNFPEPPGHLEPPFLSAERHRQYFPKFFLLARDRQTGNGRVCSPRWVFSRTHPYFVMAAWDRLDLWSAHCGLCKPRANPQSSYTQNVGRPPFNRLRITENRLMFDLLSISLL
jgi:hypothetical protein